MLTNNRCAYVNKIGTYINKIFEETAFDIYRPALDILNNMVTVGTDEKRTEFYFYDNPLYSEIQAFINSKNNGTLPNSGNIGLLETNIIENLLKGQKSLKGVKGENL